MNETLKDLREPGAGSSSLKNFASVEALREGEDCELVLLSCVAPPPPRKSSILLDETR